MLAVMIPSIGTLDIMGNEVLSLANDGIAMLRL